MNLRFEGRTDFKAAALGMFLLLGLAFPCFGDVSYLPSGQPDGVALLTPPPLPGSAEEAADMTTTRAVFRGRTEAQKERALKNATLSLSLFTEASGCELDLGKLPKTQAFLEKMKKDIQAAIDPSKNYFKRKRPYEMDESLRLGKPEPSFSYPSGHSTRGTVYALVFAELFPARREALLQIGRDIGWDRVVIGKHFPTDVYAGRVLGQAVFRQLMANTVFRQDLAGVKAEIAGAAKKAVEVQPALAK
jgi:acid phosphatase (class A)